MPGILILAVITGLFVHEFAFFAHHLAIMLGIIIWSVSLSIKPTRLKKSFKKTKVHATLLLIAFVIQPVLSLIMAVLLFDNPLLIAGTVLIGSAPVAAAAAFWAQLAKADTTLGLAFSTITLILTPFVLPVISFILLRTYITVNYIWMAETLLIIIIIPLCLGLLTQRLLGKKIKTLQRVSPYLNTLILFPLIASIVAINAKELMNTEYLIPLIIIAIAQPLISVILSFALTRNWAKSDRAPLVISVVARNNAIVVAVALMDFGRLAALPAAPYIIVQILFLAALIYYFAK